MDLLVIPWSLRGSLVACWESVSRTASVSGEGAGGSASLQPPLGKACAPARVTKASLTQGGSLLRFPPSLLLC